MTVRLDADVLRTWVSRAVDLLAEHRSTLDALNVFPVADSDTGTNLFLTLREGDRAVASLPAGAPAQDVARALTHGTLVGARGNSGVIVSQYLGALLTDLPAGGPGSAPTTEEPARRFAVALATAAEAAYQAVAEPIEGTVLTVARAMGDAAVSSTDRTDLREVLDAAVDSGYRALVRTTDQLAPLREAGVLDAGGWGLLLVLDALVEALGGRRSRRSRRTRSRRTARESVRGHSRSCSGHDHGGGAFEVMCVVRASADDRPAQALRRELSRIGESVAVVGGDDLWQAHVHTDHPLPAVDAATGVGEVSQVRVRHIGAQTGVHGSHAPALGLVTVTSAPGLAADLARAGAVVVLVRSGVAGAELERAVDDTGARTVLVLAGEGLVGRLADPEDGSGEDGSPRVQVVDGLSEVQVVVGAATLASLDSGADAGALADAVTEAIAAVRVVETDAGGVGRDRHARVVEAASSLLTRETGLLTVLAADDVPASVVDHLRAAVTGASRADVVVLGTGLPGTALVLGAE